MSVTTITPKRLFELTQSGAPVELIDVRTPVEYPKFTWHSPAIHLDNLGPSHDKTQRCGDQNC